MILNTPNLQALRTTLSLAFRGGYDQTESWKDKVASTIPSSTSVNTYGWMANQIKLREWIGPRQAIAMREHEYSLKNVPFEATFQVSRDEILDDNLGIYSAVVAPQFGEALAKHPDNSIVERIFQANPLAFDSKAFWAEDHPTFAPAGAAQTYSNDFDYELPAGDLVVAHSSIISIRSAMRTIVGENGQILSVDPRLLIVPPQLEDVAISLCESEDIVKASASQSNALSSMRNTLKGRLEFLVIEGLGDEPELFYLADVSKSIKPFLWQVRSQPIFRAFDSGADRESFEQNTYTYGIDGADGGSYRANAGVSLPFLCARSGVAQT